jgi:hypothetical protein
MPLDKSGIAKRIAQEVKDGYYEVHFIFSHCTRFLIKFRLFVVAFSFDAIY